MPYSLGKNASDTVKKGRSQEFAKAEGVKESLREQIPAKLLATLNEMNTGERVADLWTRGNSNRTAWLERQRSLEKEYDEFVDPIYSAPMSWSSTLHYPIILTVGKAYHARMFSAVTAVDPPFTVKGRREVDADNAMAIQNLMAYTIKDWANYYRGIEEPLDRGIWSWIMKGVGIWKPRWDKQFVKFRDVEENVEMQTVMRMNPQTGIDEEVPNPVRVEKEVDRVITKFDGPCLEFVEAEDVVLVGSPDPQLAEAVIQRIWQTSSDLLTLVDRKVFDADAVDEVIEGGRDTTRGSDQTDSVKQDRKVRAGESELNPEYEQDRYELLEAYVRLSIDNTGIDTDLLVVVHRRSRKILRATYLYRIMETGERPFFKADFHLREGAMYGSGLTEILYSMAKEIDAVRNMRMDFGLLSTMPFGYYRATSSMTQTTIPIEPGQLVPLDNPQADIYFPQLGNRTVFGFQEEQSLYTMIERFTGVSELTLGSIGGQGVTRTATGTRALVGESNANLNIYLRRLQRALRGVYRYMFAMLQRRLPDGFVFRLQGDDGVDKYIKIRTRAEIKGQFDFELDPNSSNSNPQIQQEVAQQIYNMTGNPLDIQLGIITPLERYEAAKNLLQTLGVKDFSRFLRKPQGITRDFTPVEMANRILAGKDFQFTPDMDLQGFLGFVEMVMADDTLLGQFNEVQAIALAARAQEAAAMLEAIQAQQAQQNNVAQMQANSQAMSNPVAAPQGPTGGQGGA